MRYAVEKLQGRPSSIGEFNHREQFEILKDLQSSDSGSVHVARIKKGEDLVVLKRRRAPELGKAKDVLNEYEAASRRASIMKKLNHSNIIRCYGYFWDFPSQSLYIVLEYANRGDLHWELQKRKRLG
ncbi:ark1, partial [Symbiodinium necroappetens]